MGLYEYLLLLFSIFFHIFNFIFSAPISFSLYFPISPSLLLFFLLLLLLLLLGVLSQACVKHSRKYFVYIIVQLLSCVQQFVAPCIAACLDSLPFTVSLSLLKLMSIESVMPSTRGWYPLSFLSRLVFSLSQHQGLFSVGSSHQVGSIRLELQLQHQSFQWIFSIDFLSHWLVWCPCSSRDSQESSPTPQYKNIISLVLSFLAGPTHIHTSLLGKPYLWLDGHLSAK